MKLTKGKISKLYNKKRQSFKKPKRKNLSNKRRTFRKRHLNLARKTLKRHNYKKRRGGAENDNEPPKNDDVATTPNVVQDEQPIQLNEDTSTISPEELPVEEVPVTTTGEMPSDKSLPEITEKPDKEKLINSLSQVVDYITEAVADKVSENITSAQYGEKPQDAFQAVNNVAEAISSSGGSKFKRTRHFRLTKKNKTKKI